MKIGICGKAGSGKDTAAAYILSKYKGQKLAFADPLKQIASIMFPKIPNEWLYGQSDLRQSIIPNAYKDSQPLTVRQLLIDIGTNFGRAYDENIWINAALHTAEKIVKNNECCIFSDIRFLNEFQSLKENSFFIIKINRKNSQKIDSISETQMDLIPDSSFDFIIENDYDINHLYLKLNEAIDKIK